MNQAAKPNSQTARQYAELMYSSYRNIKDQKADFDSEHEDFMYIVKKHQEDLSNLTALLISEEKDKSHRHDMVIDDLDGAELGDMIAAYQKENMAGHFPGAVSKALSIADYLIERASEMAMNNTIPELFKSVIKENVEFDKYDIEPDLHRREA